MPIDQKPVALLEQIRRDAATVAAWPEEIRTLYERELRAIFCNPGIVFPARTPPASVPEVAELVERLRDYERADQTYANATDRAEAAALLSAQAVMLEEARKALRNCAECDPESAMFANPVIAKMEAQSPPVAGAI
jgi:hypothetical protein